MYPSRFSTSAKPHLTLESGISTCGRSTRTALRMRVSMSAMGSVIIWLVRPFTRSPSFQPTLLPTGLLQPGNHPLVRQLAQADPANTEFSIHGAGPPTQLAAPHAARGELGRLIRLF